MIDPQALDLLVTFPNRLEGSEGESSQATIKILLNSDFISDLILSCQFLCVGGGGAHRKKLRNLSKIESESSTGRKAPKSIRNWCGRP